MIAIMIIMILIKIRRNSQQREVNNREEVELSQITNINKKA